MQRTSVFVRERDGNVELHIKPDGDEETVIVLDGHTARKIGDEMFRAGCNTGL